MSAIFVRTDRQQNKQIRVARYVGLVLVLTLLLAGGAAAQGQGPLVSITGVQNQAFPYVTTFVAVSGENGPISDPAAVNFSVQEDGGAALPADRVTVESAGDLDLRLLLALDVSMPAETLSLIKAGGTGLVDQLGPRDRAAVMIIQDDPRLIRDFTNNTQELATIISGLAPEGNYTALNQAALEATTALAPLSEGRRAVIMVTDTRNNTGARTVEEVIEQARLENVSIWTVGLGARVDPDALRRMARETGGLSFLLPDANQAADVLLEIENRLRQGYRVTFLSGFEADNLEHQVAISAAYPDGAGQETGGQAEASFVAAPGPVTVSLPGLVEGQTVRGVVSLSPQITAPGPVASVTYLVDDQVVYQADTSPHNFDWNSAAAGPGVHRLTVKVVDSAGNEGQAEVTVDVVLPLVVAVSAAQAEIEKGDRVAIGAQIESVADVTRVEFLLDDRLLGSATAPPYTFSLDSSEFVAGTHRLTVRVENNLGQQAEDSLSLRFLPPPPPPPPEPGWTDYLLRVVVIVVAVILILVVGLITATTVRGIAARQWESCQRSLGVVVANQGNARSRYELWAEDPAGALNFQFSLHGQPLPSHRATEIATAAAAAPAAPVREAAAIPSAPPRPAASAVVSNGRNLQQTTGQAMKSSSAVADVISSVANILPSAMARPLRSAVGQVRQGQAAVRGTQQASKRISRTAGQVATLPPGQRGTTGTAPAPQPPSPAESVAPLPGAGQTGRPSAGVSRVSVRTGAETPYIEPGQSLSLDLLIDPVEPYRAQTCAFSVRSRPVEQKQIPELKAEGRVDLRGLSWFSRYLPRLFVVALGVSAMAVIGYGLFWWLGTGG